MSEKQRVIVIGSGPIRIGQGIEFDYCSVHSVWALREEGYEAIIINNNPETVSTDFDTSDALFFEPLTVEDVLNLIDQVQPEGVVVQFGGQTAINLAGPLHAAGVKILGTDFRGIELAEDRKLFDALLTDLDIERPKGRAITSVPEAVEASRAIGFPLLIRPSFVLGGRAMEIVYDEEHLRRYMTYAVDVAPDRPILVDRYIVGKEVEVDCISDGTDVLIPGIMEHIEAAGVHSGDSMSVYPPVTLSRQVKDTVVEYAMRLCRGIGVVGLMNIQYVVDEHDTVYIIEVNPRASRTVPYMSKVTGVPMVSLATKCALGRTLNELGYAHGLYPERPYFAVKAPVFSFSKLTELDVSLGPEMKSTGEIMGVDPSYPHALYKAMVGSHIDVPLRGSMIATIAERDKPRALPIIRRFRELGFKVYATRGTALFLIQHGVDAQSVAKISQGSPHLLDLIREEKIDLLLNTLSPEKTVEQEGARIRRASVEHNIPCLTSLDTAEALLLALEARRAGEDFAVYALDELLQMA
ncbi:MAG TPA: carbamoyl-phosphate synthase large subunit [Armatimonadota bacterium]|nr:carbamoyl-phosphate synthase large subunit [Armatimonadota bacterium]